MTDEKTPVVTGIGDERLLDAIRDEFFPPDAMRLFLSREEADWLWNQAWLPPPEFCVECGQETHRCECQFEVEVEK